MVQYRLLPIFSPDFTLNSQIWLFNAEKWIFFFRKLGTLLWVNFLNIEIKKVQNEKTMHRSFNSAALIFGFNISEF